jgi:hypothetical protein
MLPAATASPSPVGLLDGAISIERCTLPVVVRLEQPSALPDASAAAAWVATNLPHIKALLEAHGAVHFRGFPLSSAPDFSRFVGAFGWEDLPYEDSLSLAVRTPICERVCTTNDGRGGGLVCHHEQAAAPLYPSRLFFFCEVPAPPGSGGGTGVFPSWALCEALATEQPAFLAACEAKGIQYRIALPEAPETQGASGGVGRSWKSFFSVADRAGAEARMQALGYTWAWAAGGVLLATSPVLPAVLETPGPRGPKTRVFFNQVIAQVLGNAADFKRLGGEGEVITFGDGSPLPLEPVQWALARAEALAVDLQWERGDVGLLDNKLVMHARRPWEGEAGARRVLASLVR